MTVPVKSVVVAEERDTGGGKCLQVSGIKVGPSPVGQQIFLQGINKVSEDKN